MEAEDLSLNLITLVPEALIFLSAILVFFLDLILKENKKVLLYWFSLLVVIAAVFITVLFQIGSHEIILGGTYYIDAFGVILKITILFVTAGVLIYSRDYLSNRNMLKGEYFILTLMSVLGMMILISAHSMLSVYLGVELLSLSMYSLIVYCRETPSSVKTGIKYFTMGAIATGILLFGISMVYGALSTFDISEISIAIAADGVDKTSILIGLTLMVAGVAFKLGAVPFHFWVPDVYKGTSTAVTLFVSTAPKVAAFAVAIRIFAEGFSSMHGEWCEIFIVLSIVAAVFGAIFSYVQHNIKKMLGYAAVSHIGFILLGFIAGKGVGYDGYVSSMFYVVTYAIMMAAAYGIVLFLSNKGSESGEMDDFSGLHRRNPWAAIIMLLVVLSMAGFPGTVGFYAKFLVIRSVIDADLYWLAITFVVFAVLSSYPYFRIIKAMYFDKPIEERIPSSRSEFRVLLGVNSLMVLGFGVYPEGLISICNAALDVMN